MYHKKIDLQRLQIVCTICHQIFASQIYLRIPETLRNKQKSKETKEISQSMGAYKMRHEELNGPAKNNFKFFKYSSLKHLIEVTGSIGSMIDNNNTNLSKQESLDCDCHFKKVALRHQAVSKSQPKDLAQDFTYKNSSNLAVSQKTDSQKRNIASFQKELSQQKVKFAKKIHHKSNGNLKKKASNVELLKEIKDLQGNSKNKHKNLNQNSSQNSQIKELAQDALSNQKTSDKNGSNKSSGDIMGSLSEQMQKNNINLDLSQLQNTQNLSNFAQQASMQNGGINSIEGAQLLNQQPIALNQQQLQQQLGQTQQSNQFMNNSYLNQLNQGQMQNNNFEQNAQNENLNVLLGQLSQNNGNQNLYMNNNQQGFNKQPELAQINNNLQTEKMLEQKLQLEQQKSNMQLLQKLTSMQQQNQMLNSINLSGYNNMNPNGVGNNMNIQNSNLSRILPNQDNGQKLAQKLINFLGPTMNNNLAGEGKQQAENKAQNNNSVEQAQKTSNNSKNRKFHKKQKKLKMVPDEFSNNSMSFIH